MRSALALLLLAAACGETVTKSAPPVGTHPTNDGTPEPEECGTDTDAGSSTGDACSWDGLCGSLEAVGECPTGWAAPCRDGFRCVDPADAGLVCVGNGSSSTSTTGGTNE